MNGSGFNWLNVPQGQRLLSHLGVLGQSATKTLTNRQLAPQIQYWLPSNSNNGTGQLGQQMEDPNQTSLYQQDLTQHVSPVQNNPYLSGSQSGALPGHISLGQLSVTNLPQLPFNFKNTSADQLPNTSINSRGFPPPPPPPPSHRTLLDSHGDSKLGQSNSVDSFVTRSPRSDDDQSIPLSLTALELTLQESKSYMRWYSDILARTNSRTITISDVFSFLNNFKIMPDVKEQISRIFHKIIYSINIGEFFALLRLISHSLMGVAPRRKLIKIRAPVPTPPSILSKKRQNDEDNDESDSGVLTQNGSVDDSNSNSSSALNTSLEKPTKPLDLDSFTQFMLTGERPDEAPKKKRTKKLKSVKFSDQVVTDIHDMAFAPSPAPSPLPNQQLDYSLPMDQLLDRMKQQPQQPDEDDEREVLKDMESQINHFQNLHSVDTASIGGVPASLHFHDGNSTENLNQMARMFSPSPDPDLQPQLLKPNMTGPAQMAKYYNSMRSDDNVSPLQPNVTGPADMARIFSPNNHQQLQSEYPQNQNDGPIISLQSFTSQMTGSTMSNTLQNSRVSSDGSPNRAPYNSASNNTIGNDSLGNNRPLPPPPVPRRFRSVSSPIPSFSYTSQDDSSYPEMSLSPIVPPRSPLGSFNINPASADISNSASPVKGLAPPPPPSRRRSKSNTGPPLPPKVQQRPTGSNNPYSQNYNEEDSNSPNVVGNGSASDSTTNILDDLKALQEEVDRIRDMTGGF